MEKVLKQKRGKSKENTQKPKWLKQHRSQQKNENASAFPWLLAGWNSFQKKLAVKVALCVPVRILSKSAFFFFPGSISLFSHCSWSWAKDKYFNAFGKLSDPRFGFSYSFSSHSRNSFEGFYSKKKNQLENNNREANEKKNELSCLAEVAHESHRANKKKRTAQHQEQCGGSMMNRRRWVVRRFCSQEKVRSLMEKKNSVTEDEEEQEGLSYNFIKEFLDMSITFIVCLQNFQSIRPSLEPINLQKKKKIIWRSSSERSSREAVATLKLVNPHPEVVELTEEPGKRAFVLDVAPDGQIEKIEKIRI